MKDICNLSINLFIFTILLINVILYFIYSFNKYDMKESFKIRNKKKRKRLNIQRDVKNVIKKANNNAITNKSKLSVFNYKDVQDCNVKCNSKLNKKKESYEKKISSLTNKNSELLNKTKRKLKNRINKIQQRTKDILSKKETELLELQNIVDVLEQSLVNEKIKSSSLEMQLQDNQYQLERVKKNTIEMRNINQSR